MSENKKKALENVAGIVSAMEQICALATDDDEINDVICKGYPFEHSLEEVLLDVAGWFCEIAIG